ncbi:MAG: hypothetical protein HYR84_13955 [Planctomycetes bacterium]|nr:hypothetical protein [Planctomycetota bacterium]
MSAGLLAFKKVHDAHSPPAARRRQDAARVRRRRILNAQIAAADRHIDRLVYELYGLSDDEIKIVEEATA